MNVTSHASKVLNEHFWSKRVGVRRTCMEKDILMGNCCLFFGVYQNLARGLRIKYVVN